ncbi:MAG: HD-GYP domain-containing protein [Ornithinibacter sp.]
MGIVAALGVLLTAAALVLHGLLPNATFGVLLLLTVLAWWVGSVPLVGSKVNLSFTGIVILAAISLVGPAGAGIVGMVMGPFQGVGVRLRTRVFNSGMFAIMGVAGGTAYFAAGGIGGETELVGSWEILRQVGLPLLLADLVQFLVNMVLVAIVVRFASGLSVRQSVWRILPSAAPAYLGYGVIAFIMVVLWGSAGLGSASVLLILPPLLVAQWAYRQYSEELKGHERALDVLVAAVEAKAPHLVGHSGRVAELSASMAQHLGLRAQVVADVRVAGMLHDLGLTTLPTGLVRNTGVVGEAGLHGYPQRGARLLRGLSFLSGSLDAISHHREAVAGPTSARQELSVPAFIVGLADEYDLLTEVGTPDGGLVTRDAAIAVLRGTPAGREDLLRALEQALSRRSGMVPS